MMDFEVQTLMTLKTGRGILTLTVAGLSEEELVRDH